MVAFEARLRCEQTYASYDDFDMPEEWVRRADMALQQAFCTKCEALFLKWLPAKPPMPDLKDNPAGSGLVTNFIF